MKKPPINYKSPTGVVHDGELYAGANGLTKCGKEFNVCSKANPWTSTNGPVTCKNCAPTKKMIVAVSEHIGAFGIDSPEKATFATIRARLLSAMETWTKHASGKINKERFDLDMRHDLKDLLTDVSEYTHRYKSKRWCYQERRYVPLERPIKHSIDGKVPSYYSHQCCQSNTCKCGRKVAK